MKTPAYTPGLQDNHALLVLQTAGQTKNRLFDFKQPVFCFQRRLALIGNDRLALTC